MIRTPLLFTALLCTTGMIACSPTLEPHVDKAEAVPVQSAELPSPKQAAKAPDKKVKQATVKRKLVLTTPSKPPPVHKKPKKKPQPQKAVMGWVENIKVGNADIEMKAKLDSGAKTSAIHAEIIKTLKKGDKKYVVFRIDVGDGKSEVFEERIKRWVRIKKKDTGHIRRPVVEMPFCVGHHRIVQEVSLADRDHFNYPVLVGRNMLQGKILVDTDKIYTTNPKCS